jgi:Protein of unknown function (DUF2971)
MTLVLIAALVLIARATARTNRLATAQRSSVAPRASAATPILKRVVSALRRYEVDEIYEPPADEHAVIHRYMSFAKFVSMLDKQALWFSRADLLGDRHEGSFTHANLATRAQFWGPLLTPQTRHLFEHAWQKAPHYHFINSWFMNEHESDAMWNHYVENGEGVAIRSTYKRLRDSTVNYPGLPIHLIVVKYLDYSERGMATIPETDMMAPFAFKRKAFEHEHELRAVIQAVEYGHGVETGEIKVRRGWTVEVPLDTLIESVVVAPNAPDWVRELVESLLRRYPLGIEVRPSELAMEPVY